MCACTDVFELCLCAIRKLMLWSVLVLVEVGNMMVKFRRMVKVRVGEKMSPYIQVVFVSPQPPPD